MGLGKWSGHRAVVSLPGAQERDGQVEPEVPGVPGKFCSPAQVIIAHSESKAISDFVHTVISGVLFDQEPEDCLEAVTMSLRGWKTKIHIQAVLKLSFKSCGKPRTRQNGRQWQTSPTQGPRKAKNFMVIQGSPLDGARLDLVTNLRTVVRTQTNLCTSPPPVCLFSTTRPRSSLLPEFLLHPPN